MEYSPMMLIIIWALTPSDCRPAVHNETTAPQEALVREVARPQFQALPNPAYFTFNEGKPFLLEKQPLTGIVNLKTTPVKYPDRNEDYFYDEDVDEERPSIERKDTNVGSTANELAGHELHKFLNLPAHYPTHGKYPLISSSYANTKVQGHGSSSYSNHRTDPTSTSTTTSPPPTYYNLTTTSTTPEPLTTPRKPETPPTASSTSTTTTRPTTTTTRTTTTKTVPTTRRPETTTSNSYLHYSEYDYFDYDYDKPEQEVPKKEESNKQPPELNAHSYATVPNVTTQRPPNRVVFPDPKTEGGTETVAKEESRVENQKGNGTRPAVDGNELKPVTDRPSSQEITTRRTVATAATQKEHVVQETESASQEESDTSDEAEDPVTPGAATTRREEVTSRPSQPTERTTPRPAPPQQPTAPNTVFPSHTSLATEKLPLQAADHSIQHFAIVKPQAVFPMGTQSYSQGAARPQQPNRPQQRPDQLTVVRPETPAPSRKPELAPGDSSATHRPQLHYQQPGHPNSDYSVLRPQTVFPQGLQVPHRPEGAPNQFTGQTQQDPRPQQFNRPQPAEPFLVRPQTAPQQRPPAVQNRPQTEISLRPRPTLQQQSTEPYSTVDLRPPVPSEYHVFRPSRPDTNLQSANSQRPFDGRLPTRPGVAEVTEMRPQQGRPAPPGSFQVRPDVTLYNPATDNHFIRVSPGQVGPSYSLQTSFSIGAPQEDPAGQLGQGVGQVLFPDDGPFVKGEEPGDRPPPEVETSHRPTPPARPPAPFPESYPRPHWENQWGRPPQFFNTLQKADAVPPHKRIKQPRPDLPNILPQFRPNAKIGQAHFGGPALREPPDTLQPPPLPRPQHLRRPAPAPAVHRRTGPQVTTLQMMRQGPPTRGALRADYVAEEEEERRAEQESPEEPVFVVYPAKDGRLGASPHGEEGVVVVGTRGPHTPLAPDSLGLDDIFDRVDTPVLKSKPGPKPSLKNEFPYPLVKPRPEQEVVATEEYTAFSPATHPEETTPEIDDLEINVIPNLQDYMPVATKRPVGAVEPPAWDLSGGSTVRPISVTLDTRLSAHHRHEAEGPKPQDFQAPFHASLSAPSQGWTVVSSTRPPSEEAPAETTTEPPPLHTEFDSDNFKPQLFGGFKPILPPVVEPQTPQKKDKEQEDSSDRALF